MRSRLGAIIGLVVLVVVLGAGYWIFRQYRAGQEFNRITHELMDQDRNAEAGAAFEAMLPGAPLGMEADIRRQAAECYRREGNRLELPMKEQGRYLIKAKSVDPTIQFRPDEELTLRAVSKYGLGG